MLLGKCPTLISADPPERQVEEIRTLINVRRKVINKYACDGVTLRMSK